MDVYLGLGSNLGDRRGQLERALALLATNGFSLERVSPVVESPALLPANAPADWNRPFRNCVAHATTTLAPHEALAAIKAVERELGRSDSRHWSPRPIDVDILLWGEDQIRSETLTVPHPELSRRAFVLSPLAALAPGLVVPGLGRTVLELSRGLGRNIPLWMGIVNVTPDSFSDGGRHMEWAAIEPLIDEMTAAGVHVLDFGAESTRPGAEQLSAEKEWSRLAPVLEAVAGKLADQRLRPFISVDTYHVEVARRAIASGADIINDVSGLTQPAMIELAAGSTVDWIAMHQVSLPADPARTLSTERSAAEQIEEWLDARQAAWHAAGLSLDRVIFDPGIGFGKTPLQSLELIRHVDRFVRADVRVLVGHSRKSFLRGIARGDLRARDMVTIGASLDLCSRGVDMLRVHDVPDHIGAYLGWVHAQA